MGILKGLSVSLFGGSTFCIAYSSVGPWYHGIFYDLCIRLSPYHAEMGMKGTSSVLKPIIFKISVIFLIIGLILPSASSTIFEFILLQQAITFFMPQAKAKVSCCLRILMLV